MLMIANSAFAVIKQTLENGKDIASAGNAISRFVAAEVTPLHQRCVLAPT